MRHDLDYRHSGSQRHLANAPDWRVCLWDYFRVYTISPMTAREQSDALCQPVANLRHNIDNLPDIGSFKLGDLQWSAHKLFLALQAYRAAAIVQEPKEHKP